MKLERLQAPVLLAAAVAASWPHWLWLARRAGDGSDEPWGVVALLTLAGLVWLDKSRLAMPGGATLLASGTLAGLAALGMGHMPPIGNVALALLSVGFLLTGMLPTDRPRAPVLALVLLVLPLTASLNFYLGYPLRWVCAHGAAWLLGLAGLDVSPQGAALLWNGNTVLVDAPCAGIAMLWVGLYAAVVLSWFAGAGMLRTICNLALGGLVMLAANLLRNFLLFYKEVGIIALPGWTHEAIGLLCFVLALPIIYLGVRWRSDDRSPASQSSARAKGVVVAVFLAVLGLCAIQPWVLSKGAQAASRGTEAPEDWAFQQWLPPAAVPVRLPLTAVEMRFAANFPGQIGRFADSRTVWVARHITRATRMLHPAADCYRGLGYRVGVAHVVREANATQWRCFTAERGRRMQVCERMFDRHGGRWTDVSAWYWSALFENDGEWWAVTRVKPLGDGA